MKKRLSIIACGVFLGSTLILPSPTFAVVTVSHDHDDVYTVFVSPPEDIGNSGLMFNTTDDPSIGVMGLDINWPGGETGTGSFTLDLSTRMICADGTCSTFETTPAEGTYYLWQNYEEVSPNPWVLIDTFDYPYVEPTPAAIIDASTGPIYAFTTLGISMLTFATYIGIMFLIALAVGLPLAYFLNRIKRFLKGGNRNYL